MGVNIVFGNAAASAASIRRGRARQVNTIFAESGYVQRGREVGHGRERLIKSHTDHSVPTKSGAIAQLGERIVRNDEVVGSIPTSSTKSFNNLPT